MTVQLDHDHLGAGIDALTDRVADLRQRRTEVAGRVETLLAAWRGVAADRFRDEWEQWRAGADAVADALEAEVRGMAGAAADLVETDARRADGAHALGSRLS